MFAGAGRTRGGQPRGRERGERVVFVDGGFLGGVEGYTRDVLVAAGAVAGVVCGGVDVGGCAVVGVCAGRAGCCEPGDGGQTVEGEGVCFGVVD